jgi:hypothetical protein
MSSKKKPVRSKSEKAYQEAWNKMCDFSVTELPLRIPLKNARILYNNAEGGLVKDVTVIDTDKHQAEDIDKLLLEFKCTGGNCWRNWGSKSSRLYHDSPEGLFGTLLIRGFLNPYEALIAIYEFAKICTWARKMYRNGLMPGC